MERLAKPILVLGDPRTNQNPGLLAFGILFHRWHNVLAERALKDHPDWSDEEVFLHARRWVIASLQVGFVNPTLIIIIMISILYLGQVSCG